MDLVIATINHEISLGRMLINTKRVREFHNISNSEKSKINFIWRSLQSLKKQGIITLYSEDPKSYTIPKNKIGVDTNGKYVF